MKKLILPVLTFFIYSGVYAQTKTVNPQVPEPPITTIEFEQLVFDYGIISQGEKVKNVFVFKNTGNEPLIISNARGSCGCTVPEWPKEAIMPGQTGQLLAVFDSNNKEGMQTKRVTITANTSPAETFLTLKGQIVVGKAAATKMPQIKNLEVSPDLFSIFPNPSSDLLNISFDEDAKGEVTIEIFDNSGKLMESKNLENVAKTPVQINLKNFTEGIYTASVIVGDQMRLAKQFVVSK